MHDQNNIFYAVALSVVILISWQYFFATSFLGKPTARENLQIGASAPDGAVRLAGASHQVAGQPQSPRRNALRRPHGKRRSPGLSVSTSIRLGSGDQSH